MLKKNLVAILQLLQNEPAVTAGFLNAAIAILLATGVVVHVSPGQLAGIVAGVAAVSGWVLRNLVKPMIKLQDDGK